MLMQPINLKPEKLSPNQPLSSVEMAKLWATYMGNSMSNRILSYFLKNVEEPVIKKLLENAQALTVDFMNTIKKIFTKENFPIPVGFTEEDVNPDAPRLYEDEFYVHYLKYASKAGMSLYAVAIPLVMRTDVREFLVYCNSCTTTLLEQINAILMDKGFIIKPPVIPVPKKVDFVEKQQFLKGYLGDVRPLHALEITHLYDNIENNTTSKALLLGFTQVVQNKKVRELFLRGIDMTDKAVKHFQEKLSRDSIPSPSLLDHLVTTSTVSPFSDKLMLFHKVDMFSMKIRSFGNSMAVNGRRDIGLQYLKALSSVALFVDDGANLLIEHGWMEQPPFAADREELTTKQND